MELPSKHAFGRYEDFIGLEKAGASEPMPRNATSSTIIGTVFGIAESCNQEEHLTTTVIAINDTVVLMDL